jgi:hypothetical protein
MGWLWDIFRSRAPQMPKGLDDPDLARGLRDFAKAHDMFLRTVGKFNTDLEVFKDTLDVPILHVEDKLQDRSLNADQKKAYGNLYKELRVLQDIRRRMLS